MGVRRGGQEGALAPMADQNSMFFEFFFEENSIFLGVLGANSIFCPPGAASPGKKSADAHEHKRYSINQMITVTGDFYFIVFSVWDLEM